jgi:hypothetical protein
LEEVDGYEIIIKNKRCSIYYNGIFYAHCPLVNGLYVLDLEDKFVYNINAKWAQLNHLNPTFIWHCCLGHINEKRIERLHKDVCSAHLILNHLTRASLLYLGK